MGQGPLALVAFQSANSKFLATAGGHRQNRTTRFGRSRWEMSAFRQLTQRIGFRVNARMAVATPSKATSGLSDTGMDDLESALSPKQRARVEFTRRRSLDRQKKGKTVRRSYG